MSRIDWLIIGTLSLLFIVVRLFHFPLAVNFSTDQATFSTRALELWRSGELTLVGPTASFNTQGRHLIQSSMIFYTTMVFHVIAGFDPIRASAAFVLAASLGVGLLYHGVSQLAGRRLALLVAAVYVFAPIYLRHTQFLWNPNYQLALAPVLIFAAGRYVQALRQKSERAPWWLLATGFVAGWMTLYHYQMVLALMAGILYIVLRRPRGWWWAVVSVVIGLAPLMAFEVRSHFYLTQTLLLLLRSGAGSVASSTLPLHYIATLSLLGLVVAVTHWRRPLQRLLNTPVLLGVITGLALVCMLVVLPVPKRAYGMAPHWNYPLEEKAYQQVATVVRERGLKNYAMVNTLYDTLAPVTYFLLTRDGVGEFTHDYRANDYLFVISAADGSSLVNNPAYEISEFAPVKNVERWELSPEYRLFLLERGGYDE